MKRISSLLLGVGLVALQGCSAAPGEEDNASTSSAVAPTAYINITSDGGTWYCAHAFVSNPLTVAASNWMVLLDMKGTTISGNWGNVKFSGTTGIVTGTPGTTTAVPAGATQEVFMFCANATPGGSRAAVKAYNFEISGFAACDTNSGKNPTKAALAVSMANELGRWEPDLDLAISNNKVVLSSSAVCLKNNCANTKAILGQQSYTPDQSVFNNTDYSSDLQASFARQQTTIADLQRNQPTKVPISNYMLTQVAGPVNLGLGACGPHYVFQVDYSSGANAGKPLSATDATNLMATMCFYGGFGCGGGNPYLGYITTNIAGCPSGKQCIAIDPGDGDNGSTSTTTAGSAPSYPKNMAYDPTNSLLGTQCITTKGKLGTMVSHCADMVDTCGNLYCVAS